MKTKKVEKVRSVKKIGVAPLEGYRELTKEEIRDLKKMTLKDAIEQTEILLRAAQWMK